MKIAVDHLIVFTPELERGRDHIERLMGVRPVTGGRHPDLGTHNALLGLGPDCYLEVMAPDPASPRPLDLSRLFPGGLDAPRLGTWVLRAEAIEALHERAKSVGLGAISTGHRDNPDGTRLSWRLSDPFVFPFDGVVPFLIAWGDTPHPGTRLPTVGSLTDLSVEHPDASGVVEAFVQLGVDVPVTQGPAPRLRATIATPRGDVVL